MHLVQNLRFGYSWPVTHEEEAIKTGAVMWIDSPPLGHGMLGNSNDTGVSLLPLRSGLKTLCTTSEVKYTPLETQGEATASWNYSR